MKKAIILLCGIALLAAGFLLGSYARPYMQDNAENIESISSPEPVIQVTAVPVETPEPTPTPQETSEPEAQEEVPVEEDIPVETPEPEEVPVPEETPEPDEPTEEDSIEALISQMSLREKVGQLFIIRPDSLDLDLTAEQTNASTSQGVTDFTLDMEAALEQYPAGGVIMFSKNIESYVQITEFIKALQYSSALPLFVSVDEEGGLVARLGNHASFDLPQYESAGAVGSSGDTQAALDMGSTIGAYLREFGFNMDFAPVADVNTNPDNPVIGTRAFSSDAETAAAMASAMAEGLKQQNIIPTFKHFPGHGDTAEDSHTGIAISYKTQAQMEECEWLPYGSLTTRDCVMVGHIATPEITGDLTPASMSYRVVTGILRQQLGFEGVVITDSLSMQAVTDEYSNGEAAVTAILAGCDILLTPANYQESFEAVITALEDGRISEERINESVYRILTLKKEYGILNL